MNFEVLNIDTKQNRARFTCPSGHIFVTGFFVSINIKTHSDVLEILKHNGTQVVGCPKCDATWQIAEPICVHDPLENRFAVFIPEMLAHKEIEVNTQLMQKICFADPDLIPPYVAKFETLIGTSALEKWLQVAGRLRSTNLGIKASNSGVNKSFSKLVSSDDKTSSSETYTRPSGIDFASLLTSEEDEDGDYNELDDMDSIDDLQFNIATDKKN